MNDVDFELQRRRMVETTIASRGIDDPRVLQAMLEVPRHLFVPVHLVGRAYEDAPLPIGEGQTISQPYIVAFMCQALKLTPSDRVLEIGAGSGYAAAVLSRIAADVQTVERHEGLATAARERLARMGYSNVSVHVGDGSGGWPDNAPYDAIVVAAAAPLVPEALLAQLVEGGRLVIPVGEAESQSLIRMTRQGDEVRREDLGEVRFVPLGSGTVG
jgi:protein-L-isoaspartate(D-aspartate) O-methyltransferase